MSDSTTGNDSTNNQAANKTAQDIEAAVRGNAPTDNQAFSASAMQAYGSAMAEVDHFKAEHTPAEFNQFCQSVTNKLDKDGILPRVCLFEAKADFANIDKINPNGIIEPGDSGRLGEITAFGNQKDVNELRQSFLNKINHDWMKLVENPTKYDSDGRVLHGINQDDLDTDLRNSLKQEENHKLLTHLFEKVGNNKSLYEKLIDPKDPEGNIPASALSGMIANAQDMKLTPDDIASLQLLQSEMRYLRKATPGTNDMTKEDLRNLCKDNNVDFDKTPLPEQDVLRHLFQKGASGEDSLYDRLRDHWGNIKPGKIREYLDQDAQNPARLGLTAEDRASLKLLQSHMRWLRWAVPKTDDMKKDDIQQLCQNSGLDYNQLANGK